MTSWISPNVEAKIFIDTKLKCMGMLWRWEMYIGFGQLLLQEKTVAQFCFKNWNVNGLESCDIMFGKMRAARFPLCIPARYLHKVITYSQVPTARSPNSVCMQNLVLSPRSCYGCHIPTCSSWLQILNPVKWSHKNTPE